MLFFSNLFTLFQVTSRTYFVGELNLKNLKKQILSRMRREMKVANAS